MASRNFSESSKLKTAWPESPSSSTGPNSAKIQNFETSPNYSVGPNFGSNFDEILSGLATLPKRTFAEYGMLIFYLKLSFKIYTYCSKTYFKYICTDFFFLF